MMNKSLFILMSVWAFVSACQSTPDRLPILGNRTAQTHDVNGKTVTDTIYQTIPAFQFTDQDGNSITNDWVKGKIYVADFFFVSCPTICPVMKKNMLQVYKAYQGQSDIVFLSHTIDPEHDSLPILKDYCSRLGSDGKQWKFVRGDREQTYTLAESGYYASARADSLEPGGFIHSGGFILVDTQQRVRGIYDGTNEESVATLIADIKRLQMESHP